MLERILHLSIERRVAWYAGGAAAVGAFVGLVAVALLVAGMAGCTVAWPSGGASADPVAAGLSLLVLTVGIGFAAVLWLILWATRTIAAVVVDREGAQ